MRHETEARTMVFGLVDEVTGDRTPVLVRLRYDGGDPYAITATFSCADGTVDWVFARDLLLDGMITPTGEGDVRVRPEPLGQDGLIIELDSGVQRAIFEAPAEEIREFLSATYDIAFPGDESDLLDIDAEFRRLVTR